MNTRAFWLVIALWGAGLGAAAQYGKVSVVFDLLPAVYPEAGAALGWIVSLVGLVGIIFGVIAGLLVARLRYRRTLMIALWLGAAVSALQSFLPPFPIMLALRAIEGVSHLGIVVVAPTLIAQIARPEWRGISLMLWGTFFGVAYAVLAWLGQPLAAREGIGALFAAHAIYMTGFALLLTFGLRHLPPIKSARAPLSTRHILRDHVSIYRSPYLSAPAKIWMFYTFCFVSILTVIPPYLPADQKKMVLTAMPLVSIASSMIIGGILLRVMPATSVVLLGLVLCTVTMIWLEIAPALPMACLALAAAMGLIQGAGFAAVPQLNKTADAQAQANGAMAQMGNLGNTIGTPVMTLGLAHYGYASLPIIAGGAFAMGLIVHLWLARLRAAGA